MSVDFPNRAKWLAIRHTPHNFHRTRGTLIWTSGRYGNYVRAKHGPIGQERIRGRR